MSFLRLFGTGIKSFVSTDNPVPVAIVSGSAGSAALDVSVSSAYEAARQAKAVASKLISINGYNSKATAQFIQIHNSAAAAAEGAAPADFFVAPAQSAFFYQPNNDIGDAYSTGIYVCNSSTGPTKTLGSADCWFRVRTRDA